MKKASVIILKIILTAAALFASYYALIVIGMFLFLSGINHIIAYIGLIAVPSLLLPLIWIKKRKKFLIIWCICAAVYGIALGTNFGIIRYNESITVNTSPTTSLSKSLKSFAEGRPLCAESTAWVESPPIGRVEPSK